MSSIVIRASVECVFLFLEIIKIFSIMMIWSRNIFPIIQPNKKMHLLLSLVGLANLQAWLGSSFTAYKLLFYLTQCNFIFGMISRVIPFRMIFKNHSNKCWKTILLYVSDWTLAKDDCNLTIFKISFVDQSKFLQVKISSPSQIISNPSQ